jgi:cysteine desulfurase
MVDSPVDILGRSMTYLDWAAAAPPNELVHLEAAEVAESSFANPSALHIAGRDANRKLEEARDRIGALLGLKARELSFTSGATEANNIILSSLLLRPTKGSIITADFEHDSVYQPCRLLASHGFDVRFVRAGRDGRVDPDRVLRLIDTTTMLVSLMHVNNVTGAILPIEEIVSAIRKHSVGGKRIHIHSDMSQSVGRLCVSLDSLDIDSATMSGYKIGGPRGAGLLALKRPIEPLYRGGDQEHRIRPGTENLYAVWGVMRAMETVWNSIDENFSHAQRIKSQFIETCDEIDGAVIIHGNTYADPMRYSPFIATVSFPGIPAEVLMRVLGDKGFVIATGSACSAKRKTDTRVLSSFGYSENESRGTIRVSWGPDTTRTEIQAFLNYLRESVRELKGNE